MIVILILIFSLMSAALIGLTVNIQATTVFLSKEIEQSAWRQIQDAITPVSQTVRNYLSLPSYFTAPIMAFFVNWKVGIIVTIIHLVLVFVNYFILGLDANKHINYIGQDLMKRQANYLKDNDNMRASVAEQYMEAVARIFEEVKPLHLKVRDLESYRSTN